MVVAHRRCRPASHNCRLLCCLQERAFPPCLPAMEMRELHGEVARLQALGLAFSDVKAEIGRVVAAQKACRDALAAAKAASNASSGSGSGGNAAAKEEQECWVLRPGGVWLRLPAARAEVVLRAGEPGADELTSCSPRL